LYREFCGNGSLLYGEAATRRERELIPEDFEVHSLQDPELDWLEPERDVRLLIDREERMAYHRRCINGVRTWLEIPLDGPGAHAHAETIVRFTRGLNQRREETQSTQLSLMLEELAP